MRVSIVEYPDYFKKCLYYEVYFKFYSLKLMDVLKMRNFTVLKDNTTICVMVITKHVVIVKWSNSTHKTDAKNLLP